MAHKSTIGKVRRRVSQRPEEALQIACAEFADRSIVPPALWWANTTQKGTRSGFEQALLTAMGMKEGLPDLMFLHCGQLLGSELKAPPKRLKNGSLSKAKPRLSDGQKEMHARLRAAGAVIEVHRSVGELERFLRMHGVPLRASVLAR